MGTGITITMRSGKDYCVQATPEEVDHLVREYVAHLGDSRSSPAGAAITDVDDGGLILLRWADVSGVSVPEWPEVISVTRDELLADLARPTPTESAVASDSAVFLVRRDTIARVLDQNHLNHSMFAAELGLAKSTWSTAFNRRAPPTARMRKKLRAHRLLADLDEALLWDRQDRPSPSPTSTVFLVRRDTFTRLLGQNHLTHGEFADELGVARNTWSQVFTRRVHLTAKMRNKLRAHRLLAGLDEALLWEEVTR